MRTWPLPSSSSPGAHGPVATTSGLLTQLVSQLGESSFGAEALRQVSGIVPTASLSVYRIACRRPELYFSAAQGVDDLTRNCWQAYLSGPQLDDRSFSQTQDAEANTLRLVHVRASEVSPLHRQRVYDAHDVAERLSIAAFAADGSTLAVNFYRHHHQRAISDTHLSDFYELSVALLALAQKHIALRQLQAATGWTPAEPAWRERLQQLEPGLTARELDVCQRLLCGMSQDGIAADLGLSLPTVKTYRNRAFARLDIHHRHQLFALLAH